MSIVDIQDLPGYKQASGNLFFGTNSNNIPGFWPFNQISTGIDSATAWHSEYFPAQTIIVPGAATDPDRESTTGFLLFDAASIELVYILQQFPGSYIEFSDIVPQVHWAKTTSASGDVVWKTRARFMQLGAEWEDWVDLGGENVPETDDNDTAGESLFTLWDGSSISANAFAYDWALWEISRIANDDDDTYASDVRMIAFDVKMQINSLGSRTQFEK